MTAYLDHAATTPLHPGATAAMLPWLTDRWGNPSGSHGAARDARRAVDAARLSVAGVLGVDPGDVVFTGGGTEADNLGVRGPVAARGAAGEEPGAVVVSSVEHPAVLGAARAAGTEVREVAVTPEGTLDLTALDDALDRDVVVVSVMLVNNEVGTVQPLAEAAELVRRRAPRAVLHTDAVQGLRWLDLRAAASMVDAISISGHKFGGPQGTGVLAVRAGTPLRRLVEGGGQERDRRAGTHNVAGIVGLGAAAALADAERSEVTARVAGLRDRLVAGVMGEVDGVELLATKADRVPGIVAMCLDGVESEALLLLLDEAGVAASAGSACASGAIEASHVLLAMGVPEERALGSLRLSLGATTTAADVDALLAVLPSALRRLRG